MQFKYGDYNVGANFKLYISLESGNYTYYFEASDGKNTTKYPKFDLFNLSVGDLSKRELKKTPSKKTNGIVGLIISITSAGSGYSAFFFNRKRKVIEAMMNKIGSITS